MSFRRTESGLSNSYLFFGVDVVVYIEGGNSLRREEVDNGIYTASSSDIRFWQTLFEIYRPNKKCKFCSIGSKETVKSIAIDIMEKRVENVIVAMDRDFDHINGRLINTENVIYTLGYSWENDAWRRLPLTEAFCALSGSCKAQIPDEEEIIDNYFQECSSELRHAVRIDAVLSQHGNSFFNRDSYMRYVQIEKSGMPKIDREQIRKSLIDYRNKVSSPIIRKSQFLLSTLVDCFGHLFAEYAYRILVFLLEKVKKQPKIPKDYATSMVVEKFGQLLINGFLPDLKQHYDSEFVRIMP